MSFRDVLPGDIVTRSFGSGDTGMRLIVTSVNDEFIYIGAPDVGWKFDRETGAEVDEYLRWGPQFGVTGSYLTAFERPKSVAGVFADQHIVPVGGGE